MIHKEYQKGEIILHEGKPSDFVYRIVSGEVEVFKNLDNQSIVLGKVKAGEFLGEMGVIEGMPRSASARAIGPVTAGLMGREDFLHFISENPNSAYQLIARLSERLRSKEEQLAKAAVTKDVKTYTFEEMPAKSDAEDPAGQEMVISKSADLRLTIFPASQFLASHISSQGLDIVRFPFSVGRQPEPCEGGAAVPIDLCLPDTMPYRLSRQHFALDRSKHGYYVFDLRSTLGTEVNGEGLGYSFGKDMKYLDEGENVINAGGCDSQYSFRVLLRTG
jgi:CRP-like cAMP-binding protein